MILLLAGFFGFGRTSLSEGLDDLIISEILIGGEKADEEFIEIYNSTEDSIDLNSKYFYLHFVYKKNDSSKGLTFINNSIPSRSYFVISSKEYKGKFSDIVDAFYGSGELTASWSAYISKSKNALIDIIDEIKWKDCSTDYSYDFDDTSWKCTAFPTPGEKNKFKDETVYSKEIRINELLPDPDSKSEFKEEFLELYNSSDESIDLSGWLLKDKTGEYKLSGNIESKAYLDFYNTVSLNNSDEEITLYNPAGEITSQVSYDDSNKGTSYNFNGSSWRWSKFLTPGEENVFNNLPTISSKKTNKVYVNAYADFSAEGSDADNDELKYTWDFGDGHKSYKAKTRHKYKEVGKYTAILKVSDGSEDVITNYDIEVIEFPKLKIKITAVSPNPSGADSNNEYITLKNETKKKVNLKNWSIATGWKKLINHPIKENFEIKAGKYRNLTNKYASITLNNEKSKIELRNPAGEVVDDIKYKNKDGIPDDAVYEKIKKKWKWVEKEVSTIIEEFAEESADIEPEIPAEPIETEQEILEAELQANLGKYSIDQQWQKKKENKLILANLNTKLGSLESQGRVLGASTIHTIENYYTFTSPTIPEKHWAVKFWEEINYSLNSLLSNFS